MTVYPLIIRLGPVTITGYGLMMMAAFLVGGWVMQRELVRRRENDEYAADVVVAAVVGGIIGAKLWYVALTQDTSALLSRGGLVWYGGFVGGVAAVLFNGWRKRVPPSTTMELTAPALAVGYALGRIGCFLVQDDYGIPTTVPWGMKFPQGLPPTSVAELQKFGVEVPPNLQPWDVLAVHPTQLYETAIMLTVFWALWRLKVHRHAPGWLFGVYLVMAGLERFFIEFFRAKDDRFLGPFTVAQAMSIAVVGAGAIVMARLWQRPNAGPAPSGA